VWSSRDGGRRWHRGIGVTWGAMRGRYPDDVYKLIPTKAFDR
jgi:hypothetical protein